MPLVPARFRPLYTVVLPAVDAILCWFSIVAVIVGSKVVADFTLHWFPYVWAGSMGLGTVLATFGLVFMRDHLELVGKCVLIIGFGVYATVLGFYIAAGSSSSLLTQALTFALMVILGGRVGDLIGEIGRKEADRGR
jgi:hypothetical protein